MLQQSKHDAETRPGLGKRKVFNFFPFFFLFIFFITFFFNVELLLTDYQKKMQGVTGNQIFFNGNHSNYLTEHILERKY
jgi:hypothetical protein